MISASNTKLGNIPNYSLPPVTTCPGATELCKATCYVGGKKGYYKQYPSVRKAYTQNLADVSAPVFTIGPDNDIERAWVVDVMRYLSKHKPSMFRIQVSGDFHKADYIRDWSRIVAMFPATKFLAFTRSWRVTRLRKALEVLRSLPNMQLIASNDAEAFDSPKAWRKAWMGSPADGHSALLCPGYGPKELTCDTCGLCFRPVPINVYFPIH